MTMINEEGLGTEEIFTYVPATSKLELPRLIYPVSFLGAVNLDSMKKLAEALGASYVDRAAVTQGSLRGQIKELPSSVGKTAKRLLEIGDDVVLGENFNGRGDRTNLTKIAKATGATTICLSIWADKKVATRRVNEWVASGLLDTPKNQSDPLDVMSRGLAKHHVPRLNEADHVFELDGTLGTAYLIDRVFDQLEEHALIDESLSRMDPRDLAG